MASTGLINRGTAAYKAGSRDEARALFAEALIEEPESELGWLWFATVATDRGEQRYCVDRALEINPESNGRARLRRLHRVEPVVPPELVELDPPGLPPDLQAAPVRLAERIPLRPIRRRGSLAAPQEAEPLASPAAQPIPAMVVTEEVLTPDAEASVAAAPTDDGDEDRPPRRSRWPWLAAAAAVAALVLALAIVLRGEEEHGHTVAIVVPRSGPLAFIGEEQINAAQMTIDEINADGGIDGHGLELAVYDDENNPDVARQRAQEIVADEDVLMAIGHYGNDASLAAGEVYGAAGLPVVSAAAAADPIFVDKPWSFTVVVPASTQGAFAAQYARDVLGATRFTIVGSGGPFAQAAQAAFDADARAAGATVKQTSPLDEADAAGSIQRMVTELQADPDPGTVLLSLPLPEAQEFLRVSRRAGVTPPMIALQTVGYGDFADVFESEPEEREDPGFFTDGLVVASPLVYDSLGGAASQFADRYRARYGGSPEWFGAKVYDAVNVGARALAMAEPDDLEPTGRRQAVRDALAGMNTPSRGTAGLATTLYFPEGNDVPQAMKMAEFLDGQLLSEPTQYRVVINPEQFDLEEDRAAGKLIELGNRIFRQYRVVYVGLDMNEVSDLNTESQTFNADFFLWFRYYGDPSATDVAFTNSSDPTLSAGEPLSVSGAEGEEQFAMYRVNGTFAQALDFRDYPWDVHQLTIGLINRVQDETDIVYVTEGSILAQSQEERLRSGFNFRQPFNQIPNWEAVRLFFQLGEQTARSAVPDEETNAPGYVRFSSFEAQMTFQRDVRSFLIKNLLPLALLALVTYISLFFSADQAGSRIGFAITSLLTSSVLLSGVSGQLPDIGYTVAIEWGFYAYLALSGLLVFYNIIVERLYKQKRFAAVRRIDTAARILYPVIIGAVVIGYAVQFA